MATRQAHHDSMTDGTSDPVGPAAPSAPAAPSIPTHVAVVAREAGANLGLSATSVRHLATILDVFNREDNGGRPAPGPRLVLVPT